MAYDAGLAQRARESLSGQDGLVEKKMFGGVGFMVHGNMACGVNGDDLIVRVGPEAYGELIMQPFTRPFDMTGRPMKGWLVVEPEGLGSEEDLADWIALGTSFALSLPAK